MRAIVVDRFMEPTDLAVREMPSPPLLPGSLRVEVRAAGCNFFDILMVRGRYQVKPPFPFVPGAEIAGVVREVAPDVRRFSVGERVLASNGLGGFAEECVVSARSAYALPDAMSFEEGAALPIIYPTSYAGLVDRGALRAGETLLVHAAAGGVGSAAVQIGCALGARVIGTAGGADKCAIAVREGCEECIDYRAGDFVARVQELTQGRGADVIYDSVGGEITDQSLKCIAWNGRLVIIGFASGKIPSIQANRILLKNIAVTGLHWGAHAQKDPKRIGEVMDALFAMHAKGQIRPVVYDRYPLDEVPAALAALGGRESYGKVIVTPRAA
jgi:NADPH2:quinone reductase